MEVVLDAARSAGASVEAVQLRIAADERFLKSASEKRAYLCGLHAAFLTLVSPTFVAKPERTPPLSESDAKKGGAPTSTSPSRTIGPTLASLGRQQPSIRTVDNLADIDLTDALTAEAKEAVAKEEESSRRGPPAHVSEPSPHRLPPASLLKDRLRETAPPLSGEQRFPPSRWLLLSCYEATHGLGCPLSELHRGVLPHALRERSMVSLFFKLTGGQRHRTTLSPGLVTVSVTESSALYAEASVIHRRASAASSRAMSQQMRRWLLAEPTALTSTPARGSPSPPVAAAAARPLYRSRLEGDDDDCSPPPTHTTLHGFTVYRPQTVGGGILRMNTDVGFNSGAARALQPTSAEEATQRDIWGC